MERLPAQGCDPLAVASERPADLLPCAWVPQENLRDRSSANNPPQPSAGPTQGPPPIAPQPCLLEDPSTSS